MAEGNRPVSLYRSEAEAIHPNTFEVSLFGSLFNTLSTYDDSGAESALDSDQGFSMIDGGLEARYCFKSPFEIRAGVNGRMITNVDGDDTLSATGLESYWVGAKYAFRQGLGMRYSLDFKFRQTLYSNTPVETIPASYNYIEIGDGGIELDFGFHLAYLRSRSNTIGGSVYYRLPANELSPEIVYNFELAWAFRNFALFFGTDGIYSMNGSAYTDDPSQKPPLSTGVSNLFNSLNRSNFEPYAGLSIAFSSWRVSLKGSYTMVGVSTDRGYRFLGSLTWSGKPVKGNTHREKVSTFKEYEIEASVIKVSPRGKFVKIDQGMAHDVEKGMLFDIYKSDYFGGNVLLASGTVYDVAADWAIIKITRKYKNVELKPGLYARGL